MGNLFFGDSKQKIPVLFDTGSPMVYVLNQKCDKALCPQEQKFDTLSSGSYKENADGDSEVLAHCYGKGCVSGAVSKDRICFSSDPAMSCLSGATFLSVNEATDIEKDKFSGIIGLGPKSDVGRMPSFVEQMANLGGEGGENEIKPMFSLYLTNNEDKKGKLTIGGYDVSKYGKSGSTENDIFWADMAHKRTFFWTLNMGQIQLGQNAVKVDSKHLILDSGLSYALIPSDDYKVITTTLAKYGVDCKANGEAQANKAQVSSSSCSCKDYQSLPALKFNIFQNGQDQKGKQFSMPKETYIKDEGAGKC